MRISEIFYSIEGEGTEIGRPEVFIRLSKCNLKCSWCDTKYAWNDGDELSIETIVKKIKQYKCQNISITGGEPLLQKKELLALVELLKKKGYWIQLNTNGTLFDAEIFDLVDLISMDCKCPSSGMKSSTDVLEKTKNTFESKTQFKFVISNEEDYRYAKSVISSILVGANRIVFQPEWTKRTFTQKLVEMTKKDELDAKIIVQQHKLIWGDKKGV